MCQIVMHLANSTMQFSGHVHLIPSCFLSIFLSVAHGQSRRQTTGPRRLQTSSASPPFQNWPMLGADFSSGLVGQCQTLLMGEHRVQQMSLSACVQSHQDPQHQSFADLSVFPPTTGETGAAVVGVMCRTKPPAAQSTLAFQLTLMRTDSLHSGQIVFGVSFGCVVLLMAELVCLCGRRCVLFDPGGVCW